MPYSDLPEPKFSPGQTVWYADTTRQKASHPCPDCAGSKVWNVTTPTGGAYEVPCQRCGSGFTYTRQDEIVPLEYAVAVACPKSFVVKDIEVRSHGFGSDGPQVSYSGRYESSLYATLEEARAVSEVRAILWNAEQAKTPERLAQKNIGKLKIADAKVDQFANGLWNAWYAYNSLCEKLDQYLDGKDTLTAEDVGYLKSDIRWETEYRCKAERPLDALVDAVRAALAGDPSLLQPAFAALPEAIRTEISTPADEFA